MFLFIFCALVVLYPLGQPPDEGRLVWDLAQMLESSMGTSGRYLFLVIGMAAMFSTQLTVIDGGVRMWSDVLKTNFARFRTIASGKLYVLLAVTLMCVGTVSTWWVDTYGITVLDFLFLNAAANGFAMAVYVPYILYLNHKLLPPVARPHPVNIVMVLLGASVYISFALYLVATKIGSMIG